MHKEPREYFIDKLEEDTKEIEEQLDELEARLEDAGWEPELDYEKQIENIRFRIKEFKKELDRFEVNGKSTWGAFKKYYGNTLSGISKDIQEFTAQLNNILIE